MNSTQGIPRSELGERSTIAQMRKSPPLLQGIFVELTRQVFSAEFQDPSMGWLWHPDPARTKIWIDNAQMWHDNKPLIRPAVYISLPTITYSSYTGRDSGLARVNLMEAEYEYQRTGDCDIMWTHIGNTNGESTLVATNTLDYMDAFSDAVRKEFCFDKFFVKQFTTAQVEKEDQDKYRNVIVAHITFQENWTLKLESPKLKRVVLDAGQRALDLLGSLT